MSENILKEYHNLFIVCKDNLKKQKGLPEVVNRMTDTIAVVINFVKYK